MILIFGASSIPNLQRLPGDVSDKTGHFVGYAMLGALLLRGTANVRWAGVRWRASLGAVAGSALYGALDEYHQWFVPGRFSSVADWVADVSGAMAAVIVGVLAARVLRGRGRAV